MSWVLEETIIRYFKMKTPKYRRPEGERRKLRLVG